MTLDPILSAPVIIQLHAASAIIALLLGPIILMRKKGDARHRFLGRLWVGVMAIAVGSSWFISEMPLLGRFSSIHIFSALGTVALFQIVWFARNGHIQAHRSAARGLYIGGLVVTGAFTFMPGRIMNQAVFGGSSIAGFYLVLGLVLAGFTLRFISNRIAA